MKDRIGRTSAATQRSRAAWLLGFAALVTLGAACADDTPRESGEPLWQLDSAPMVSIGEEDDPENPTEILQRITGATRLPDGSVLVSDLGEFALKLFDESGGFVRAFGRSGGGPGEVTYAARLFRCGDSLYVYDIDGDRTSLFTLDGEYVRRFGFQVPEGERVPYSAGSNCNPAAGFVHYGWGNLGASRPGQHRGNAPLWVTDSPDGPARLLDSIPGSERWGMVVNGRFVGSRPLPLGKQPVSGIGRERVYSGTADSFHINVYALDGSPLPPLRRDIPPAPLTQADVRAFVERQVAVAGETQRSATEAEYADITFPATHPAYTALLVDAEDHVWVRHPERMGAAEPNPSTGTTSSTWSTWSVFSPDGAFVTEVLLPRNLQPFEIGPDYVLGRYLNPEQALPLVRLYRLQRNGTG